MTYEEILNLVAYNNKESKLYIRNEIFEDMKKNIRNTPHRAFAYSYIYFTTWLYRYAKYFNVDELLDNKAIKKVLGYSPTNQTMDYLIKKGGLLDEIGWTESDRDFPISWEYEKGVSDELKFLMSSTLDKETLSYLKPVPKRFFLKRPVKSLRRTVEEDGEEYEVAGSFHDVSNTHMIPFEVFLHCMSKEELGATAFYLYSYFKHKNDLHDGEYGVALVRLSEDTGVSETGLDRYLGALKQFRMIDFQHNQDFFVAGMLECEREANSYLVRDYDFFNQKPVPFKRISIMKREDYLKIQAEQEAIISPYKAEIDISELPY